VHEQRQAGVMASLIESRYSRKSSGCDHETIGIYLDRRVVDNSIQWAALSLNSLRGNVHSSAHQVHIRLLPFFSSHYTRVEVRHCRLIERPCLFQKTLHLLHTPQHPHQHACEVETSFTESIDTLIHVEYGCVNCHLTKTFCSILILAQRIAGSYDFSHYRKDPEYPGTVEQHDYI